MSTPTKRYAIVVEKAKANYPAYVPDLPGCVATGTTVQDTERRASGLQAKLRFYGVDSQRSGNTIAIM